MGGMAACVHVAVLISSTVCEMKVKIASTAVSLCLVRVDVIRSSAETVE